MTEHLRPLVLLVEDDANDILMFRRAFSKSAQDATLITVEGMEPAERYLEKEESHGCVHPPSLTLLDLKMPGKSGLDLLAWIRSREPMRWMPVVAFSSSGEPADIKSAYRLGANSYIIKPSGSDSLFNTVQKILTYWLVLNQKPGKEPA